MTNAPGAGPHFSRRAFLVRSAAVGLGTTFALSACSHDPAPDTSDVTVDIESLPDVVVVNHPLWIDDDTEKEFEEAFGINLRYEEYTDAAAYLDEHAAALASGAPPADIVVLPDAVAARAVRDSLLAARPEDFARDLVPAFTQAAFDVGRTVTLPWQGWIVSICFDGARVERVPTTVASLLEARYAGEVSFPSDPRLALGTLLIADGASPTDVAGAGEADLRGALRRMTTLVRRGHFVSLSDTAFAEDLVAGRARVAVGAAPRVTEMEFRRPKLRSVVAEDGALLDGGSVFVTATDPDRVGRARAFLDTVYSPERNAQIARFMASIPPVPGGIDALREAAPELAARPTIGVRDAAWARIASPPVVPDAIAADFATLVAGSA